MTTAADPFVHPALFYDDPASYLAGTIPFIREGLEADEPVAVAVPGPRLELIGAELGADAGRVRLMDMTKVGRNPGRIIPGVLRAFADAHAEGPVRIVGEPIWADRSELEYPACVQHEALINLAFTGRRVAILCPYDAKALDPQVIADARATHPVVMESGGTRPSAAYDPEATVAAHNQPLPEPPAVAPRPFDAEGLPVVRHEAVGRARDAGLAGMRLVDFEVSVAELTTNSVVHGGGSGRLRVWSQDGYLVCEVRDDGRIDDPLAGRRPPARDQLGGRGLLMVNTVADLVRTHHGPGGTTVRAYFEI